MPSTVWSGNVTFTAQGTQATTVAVPMPHRGVLKGYSLVEAAGGATGNFTAALYSSKQDKEPNSTLPADTFKVLAFDQTTAFKNDLNVSYLNRDGTPSNPQRYLYLKITPAATKSFVFSVTVDTPTLR
jgi:type V secretory pathway adhesin AidA